MKWIAGPSLARSSVQEFVTCLENWVTQQRSRHENALKRRILPLLVADQKVADKKSSNGGHYAKIM